VDQAMLALTALRSEVDLSENIITYCSNSDCDEGLELALLLRQAGYTRVALFAGGLNEWIAAGGAVESDHDITH
jgi:rhodanese-related sulfurtransferase